MAKEGGREGGREGGEEGLQHYFLFSTCRAMVVGSAFCCLRRGYKGEEGGREGGVLRTR